MDNEKLVIQIGKEVIELKGADKEAFIANREAIVLERSLIEAEQQAKAEAKASAMAKLAALGLSDEEVQAIIGA